MPLIKDAAQIRAASGARLDMETNASPPKIQRISALDFTRGALVLIMVLYHWINYFVGSDWPYYPYLRFLTPSFIFIAGFMISSVYLAKYNPAERRLPMRLFTRGVKLLAIFLVLNVARLFIVPLLSTGVLTEDLFDPYNIFIVFVSGNLSSVSGKLVSFSILVPISYLLMLSGVLILPYRFYRYTFHAVCLLFLLSILILDLMGAPSPNLEFVTIGMLGVLTGFVPISQINNLVRHPFVLAVAYVSYLVAITFWNVPFPLLIVGVILNLAVIYLIGLSGGGPGVARSEAILLGKYSLFGYISQIAILQILSVGFHHFHLQASLSLPLSFVAAFALTIASVEILDRARTKMVSVDKMYKVVFA